VVVVVVVVVLLLILCLSGNTVVVVVVEVTVSVPLLVVVSTSRATGVVDVLTKAGDVAFWSPRVFQMLGPTELNQGGRGRAVDDVGVAISFKYKMLIYVL